MIVSGVTKKVYSQEMKTRDMWEEVIRRFSKENSAMNATIQGTPRLPCEKI